MWGGSSLKSGASSETSPEFPWSLLGYLLHQTSLDPRTEGLWLLSSNVDKAQGVSPNLGAAPQSLSLLLRYPPPTTGVTEQDLEGNSLNLPRCVFASPIQGGKQK